MAIDEYCGEELELHLQLWNDELVSSNTELKEIGIHVIVEKPGSFEEWEWEWNNDIDNQRISASVDVEEEDEIDSQSGTDRVILKHHRLHHPLLGSIASSTREQWISYLLKMLQARDVPFISFCPFRHHIISFLAPRPKG
ncbi:unnamed protein product [Dovyalis caffra]|uniref:Uncharacterized protein n=1 Tax=Dovyalis caffra TaxID=77055 RepID=A0AAV1RTE2_9ROSI|nr:unnamed protein product [Dovyalis caffra]